jgi:hypothetical protein
MKSRTLAKGQPPPAQVGTARGGDCPGCGGAVASGGLCNGICQACTTPTAKTGGRGVR